MNDAPRGPGKIQRFVQERIWWRMLDARDWLMRRDVEKPIYATHRPPRIKRLEWALADESRMVRIEAAKGVGLRGNADSIPKLEPLLKDDHNAVRCMAAASIIRLASNSATAAARP